MIDEIQKLPSLLDEVQRQIDTNLSLRFILTGSSARKLRRKGVNLLGGRAHSRSLHPLTHRELVGSTQGKKAWRDKLQWGGIPSILLSAQPKKDLQAYIGLYLQEEIRAEGLTRSVENFSRFLDTAALSNGEQLNFNEVANDAQVPPRTVGEYFQVLEDTLIGRLLPAFRRTKSRKAVATGKFYFFDAGVANALLGRWDIQERTPEHGRALEHLVFTELVAAIEYLECEAKLFFWRSTSLLEVDFVIQLPGQELVGIEVKSSTSISRRDLKALLALSEEFPQMRKIVVSLERQRRTTEDGVEVYPVEDFLQHVWDQKIM